ncbi:MAG: RES family NAD+ phosphorylase [Candidatus Binataceae bacterium]
MRWWRLARRRHAALDGAGARRYGGRWNRPGQSVVYTSQHLSLALLEIIVHLELSPEELPDDYVKIAIEIPDDLKLSRLDQLPQNDDEMLDVGVNWHDSGLTVGLLVPSVIIPEERNLLLNPTQPDFARVESSPPELFKLDQRLSIMSR